MVYITLKYTDYGPEETGEFKDYIKNLIGYTIDSYEYGFNKEDDPMFDTKVVANLSTDNHQVAFDTVNQFMIEREVNGEGVPFDVDMSSVSLYVSGDNAIQNYVNSKSFTNLYERTEINEDLARKLSNQVEELNMKMDRLDSVIHMIGADKFPEIVNELIESMEHEGHSCKQKIQSIINRRVH